MIISPPFIPSPVAGESDDEFLARAMVGGIPGDGGFPLSFDLNWHGGVHLTAPLEDGVALAVRAICNGELVYFRKPTSEVSVSANHPLRYRDAWTDDGCIIVKHETEIGEGDKAKVVFYSIYVHLAEISLVSPALGMRVYRKDELGFAGSIYGSKNKIHFEIIADGSQIANLTGRSETELSYKTASGRVDSCWGDMYYFLPPEINIYSRAPNDMSKAENSSEVVYRCPAMPSLASLSQGADPTDNTSEQCVGLVNGFDQEVATKLQSGIFVQINYASGQCTTTSLMLSGDQIGVRSEKSDYEYNLLTEAKAIYPECPSAGYELLRFGRTVGPDQLTPFDAAHWRQIVVPSKSGKNNISGWVNLNSPTISKFSDADFPQWKGWNLVGDDTDADSHCQSPIIRSMLGLNIGDADGIDAVTLATSPSYDILSDTGKLNLSKRYVSEREVNKAALENAHTQGKTKYLICKFPTEWSKSDFDASYGWLLKVGDGGPLSLESYNKLKEHQEVLGFWEEAAIDGINKRHWHFPPKEFISVFRNCPWLSLDEFAYTLPKYHFYEHVGTGWSAHTSGSPLTYQISHSVAKARFEKYYVDMNKVMAKYGINSVERRSHFLAQTTLETDRWRTVSEYGSGHPNPHIPMAQYYAAFYGRGILQLTWAGNYEEYGSYRAGGLPNAGGQYAEPRITATSVHYWAAPTAGHPPKRWAPRYDPTIVKSDSYNACDSGGFYWVSKTIDHHKHININRKCDMTFDATYIGSVSVLVNGGGNGYYERQAYAHYIYRYLSDSLDVNEIEAVATPHLNVTINFSMSKPV